MRFQIFSTPLVIVVGVVRGASTSSAPATTAQPKPPQCLITAKQCKNYPQFTGKQFPDAYGSAHMDTDKKASYCIRRAEDFHHWCGNGRTENATVAATYTGTWDSQVYHPDACEQGWSLYHRNCYVHVWSWATWWEAEAWCNMKNGNLCSIHGPAENDFVFTLTKGLTSWIGYQDNDQDQEYKWSDSTPSDFENMAVSCTGRETEPDCQPQEQAAKWYHTSGEKRSTWVCKKQAKYHIGLVRNTQNEDAILSMDWDSLRRPLDEAIKLSMPQLDEDEAEPEETSMHTKKKKKGGFPMKEPEPGKECLNCWT